MSTGIEWTEKTWNPIRGCSLVSEGCRSCYAMKQAHRFSGPGGPYEGLTRIGPNGPTWTGDIRLVPEKLTEPLSWKKPRRVFVNSMSDLFQDGVPDRYIDQVFTVMALCPQHTFQVLTKRAERMLGYFDGDIECMLERWADAALTIQPLGDGEHATEEAASRYEDVQSLDWPLPNVWLGVSVENQHFADERIPLLLQTPAAVRFISAEPLLESIDIRRWLAGNTSEREHGSYGKVVIRRRDGLDWVIVGGESGPHSRPFFVRWVRDLKEQIDCSMGATRLFVKQLGAHVIDRNDAGFEGDTPRSWPMDTDVRYHIHGYREDYQGAPVRIMLRKKGGVPEEWPRDFRVRDFPMR